MDPPLVLREFYDLLGGGRGTGRVVDDKGDERWARWKIQEFTKSEDGRSPGSVHDEGIGPHGNEGGKDQLRIDDEWEDKNLSGEVWWSIYNVKTTVESTVTYAEVPE